MFFREHVHESYLLFQDTVAPETPATDTELDHKDNNEIRKEP